MHSRLTFLMLALLLVPTLVFGTRVQHEGDAVPSSPPDGNRGEEWIQYDMDAWPYYWGESGRYMGNMFFPLDPNWYPFQVSKVQFIIGLDGASNPGVTNRIRVFDGAPSPVAEWVDVPITTDVWLTVTATSPPTIASGAFYAAAWNNQAGGDDSPLQGTVDAGLWPGPHWPSPNIEPFIMIDGPSSAATGGWVANTTPGSGYPTTSVASFRVLVSADTVPVELYSLEGNVRRGYVVLSWSTATEQDNFGFNVYRSDTEAGEYAKINDQLIPGHGTSAQPHDYSFGDYGVERGQTYYYKVEDVASDGSSTFHGPIAVPIGSDFVSSWGEIKATFK